MSDPTHKVLDVKFSNDSQARAYWATERNQLTSGAFNNGKSFGYCLKATTLLSTYAKYKFVIARQVRADLMKTTYQTFYKICPKDFILSQNLQEGYTYLKNESRIDWMHLDGVEDSTLRGLEINSVFTDQAEEVSEKAYDILDSRIGRWDEAIVPPEFIEAYPEWPQNELTGKYIAPSYHLNACNPDTQFHHLYRHYHPLSLERLPNHFYTESEWDTKLGSKEAYTNALRHDDEWVEKYIKGQWGVSNAQIHRLYAASQLDFNEELLERILSKANLFRVMDHGDASPTSCLWFAAINGIYICYREYYSPGKVISEHRRAINDLSGSEKYSGNYADPAIFKKSSQKEGSFWTVADEYMASESKEPPLHWQPADNNEFATRNRINELLKPREHFKHPITGEPNSPGLYFIKKSVDYPQGCFHAIKELGSQRRVLIGYFEGKALYADDREKSVADHAYDCVRYFVAMHGSNPNVIKPKVPRQSIQYYKNIMARSKNRMIGPHSSR